MTGQKQVKQLARQLFQMSLVEGRLSDERVSGVLQYIEKSQPAHTLAVLHAYQRLVAAEISRNQAVVEHAGSVSPQTLQTIAVNLGQRYGRPVTAIARPNPELLAGFRVRIGDDVYESSVAGQLEQLRSAV